MHLQFQIRGASHDAPSPRPRLLRRRSPEASCRQRELRDEIELEENLQRKDLTAYERAKTVVKLAETARQVLTETCSESEQVSRPARGPSRTAGSLRDVAERIGEPVTNIVKAQQHVETAETYPELQGPGWKQKAPLRAGEGLNHRSFAVVSP